MATKKKNADASGGGGRRGEYIKGEASDFVIEKVYENRDLLVFNYEGVPNGSRKCEDLWVEITDAYNKKFTPIKPKSVDNIKNHFDLKKKEMRGLIATKNSYRSATGGGVDKNVEAAIAVLDSPSSSQQLLIDILRRCPSTMGVGDPSLETGFVEDVPFHEILMGEEMADDVMMIEESEEGRINNNNDVKSLDESKSIGGGSPAKNGVVLKKKKKMKNDISVGAFLQAQMHSSIEFMRLNHGNMKERAATLGFGKEVKEEPVVKKPKIIDGSVIIKQQSEMSKKIAESLDSMRCWSETQAILNKQMSRSIDKGARAQSCMNKLKNMLIDNVPIRREDIVEIVREYDSPEIGTVEDPINIV